MSESKQLTLNEKALKLKISVMNAKQKPLLAKTKALESVLDEAVLLIMDITKAIE